MAILLPLRGKDGLVAGMLGDVKKRSIGFSNQKALLRYRPGDVILIEEATAVAALGILWTNPPPTFVKNFEIHTVL